MNAHQGKALDTLGAFMELAARKYPSVDLSDVYMTFTVKGVCAGTAQWQSGRINLNDGLLSGGNAEQMCAQTVPHELAHIIANRLAGRKISHGKIWKQVMRTLGVEPLLYHTMDVSKLRTRTERVYPAACGCDTTDRTISIRRGNNILRNKATYTCRLCRQPVNITGPARSK